MVSVHTRLDQVGKTIYWKWDSDRGSLACLSLSPSLSLALSFTLSLLQFSPLCRSLHIQSLVAPLSESFQNDKAPPTQGYYETAPLSSITLPQERLRSGITIETYGAWVKMTKRERCIVFFLSQFLDTLLMNRKLEGAPIQSAKDSPARTSWHLKACLRIL